MKASQKKKVTNTQMKKPAAKPGRARAGRRRKGAVGKFVKQQTSVGAAYATGQAGKAPRITRGQDFTRVQHRELVTNLTGTTAFTVASSLSINPGLSATFPWLSIMANAFEEYRFNSLKVEYFTRTGTNIPGSVIIAPDYDASDGAPASEQIASSYMDSCEDAPWKDIVCTLPSGRLNRADNNRFVRAGALGANQDIKLYDAATVHLCTVDGTAVNWGKIWLSYDVTFRIPQLNPAGNPPFGGGFAGANTQTGANPLGIAPTTVAGSKGFTISAASVITFTALGDFLVGYVLTGTVITAAGGTAGAGVTFGAQAGATFNAAATIAVGFFPLRVTSLVGATFTLTSTATTITAAAGGVGQAPSLALF